MAKILWANDISDIYCLCAYIALRGQSCQIKTALNYLQKSVKCFLNAETDSRIPMRRLSAGKRACNAYCAPFSKNIVLSWKSEYFYAAQFHQRQPTCHRGRLRHAILGDLTWMLWISTLHWMFKPDHFPNWRCWAFPLETLSYQNWLFRQWRKDGRLGPRLFRNSPSRRAYQDSFANLIGKTDKMCCGFHRILPKCCLINGVKSYWKTKDIL